MTRPRRRSGRAAGRRARTRCAGSAPAPRRRCRASAGRPRRPPATTAGPGATPCDDHVVHDGVGPLLGHARSSSTSSPRWSAWPITSAVMFGSGFMMLTTRLSSAACSSVTSALPSGKRADVSSTTRTPTLRGTAGLIVRLLTTVRGLAGLGVGHGEGPRACPWPPASGTSPLSVMLVGVVDRRGPAPASRRAACRTAPRRRRRGRGRRRGRRGGAVVVGAVVVVAAVGVVVGASVVAVAVASSARRGRRRPSAAPVVGRAGGRGRASVAVRSTRPRSRRGRPGRRPSSSPPRFGLTTNQPERPPRRAPRPRGRSCARANEPPS